MADDRSCGRLIVTHLAVLPALGTVALPLSEFTTGCPGIKEIVQALTILRRGRHRDFYQAGPAIGYRMIHGYEVAGEE